MRLVQVMQFMNLEGAIDRSRSGSVGQVVGEALRNSRRAVKRDGPAGDVGGDEGVKGSEQVGAVVSVEVGDPDGIEIAEGDVLLKRPKSAGSGVNPELRCA